MHQAWLQLYLICKVALVGAGVALPLLRGPRGPCSHEDVELKWSSTCNSTHFSATALQWSRRHLHPKMTEKEQGCHVRLNTPLGLPYIHIEVCALCHFSSCESWGDLVILCLEADVTCVIVGGGWGMRHSTRCALRDILVTIVNQCIQKLRRRDPRRWLWVSGEPRPSFHARSVVACGSSIGQDLRVTKWLPYILPVAPLTCGDRLREQIYVKTPCGTGNWLQPQAWLLIQGYSGALSPVIWFFPEHPWLSRLTPPVCAQKCHPDMSTASHGGILAIIDASLYWVF